MLVHDRCSVNTLLIHYGRFIVKIVLSESRLNLKSAVPYALISIELILGLLGGFGLVVAGAGGGAWILGGIVAGAFVFYLYRSRYNRDAEPNRSSRRLGQILVGLTIGFSIQHSNLWAVSTQLPIFLLLTLFLLLSGAFIGYLYSRIEKIDLLTALLATVPGNIGVMASMAADYGKNTALVSLIQLIRFTTVITFVPLIANVSTLHDVNAIIFSLTHHLFTFDLTYLFSLTLLLIVTASAVHFGRRLKIPVAAFFCSIVVGLVFNLLIHELPWLSQPQFIPPSWMNLVGQALLGITIGEYWGINPSFGKRTLAYAPIPVVLTFLASFLSAGLAKLLTPWDWLTCLLVTSPGGSPEMILIALTLHHTVEIVTAGHLVRLMTINLLLPALVSFADHLEKRTTQAEAHLQQPSETTTLKNEV